MSEENLNDATEPRSVDQQQACSACLFIGGPDDGRRRNVPDGYAMMRTIDSAGTHHEYRKELLGAPGKTWRVFIHMPLTMTAAMDMLLAGYKQNSVI